MKCLFKSLNALTYLKRSFVNVKVHNHIAELILARHEGKNSLSRKMVESLENGITTIKRNPNVRVMILRSEVEKIFCAGADLKERLTMPADQVGAFVNRLRNAFQSIATIPFPTVAAIDGAALGGGLEMALACDIRIAAAGAILGLPETNLAILPGAGGTQRLPRLVGLARAKQLIFTGARLNGVEAQQIGLVNEIVLEGSSYTKALELAKSIVDKGPIAVRSAKQSMDEGIALSLEEALEVEKRCYELVIPTKDRIEGLKSFTEKRKPQYIGE
jgi:methylglutaconyl-CoA hydratase